MALRELPAADWQVFERFASEFLAVDFPSLRTMASPGGDKGRDAQLYVPTESPTTAIQYSVTADWEKKIRKTLARVTETMKGVTRLIYCTNQQIGPAADSLVEELRTAAGVALDIRDRSWFVERELTAPQRQAAAEELSARVVDPLLKREGVSSRAARFLSDEDARVALLHLTLEGYDAQSDRNLTKSSFEALVLSALHDTTAESTLGRSQIRSTVERLVPTEHKEQLDAQVEGALKRLSSKGGRVKHIAKIDNFHLSYDEQLRRAQQTTEFLHRQRALEDELEAAIASMGLEIPDGEKRPLVVRLREGIEEILFRRGEAFARTISSGVMTHFDIDELLAFLTTRGDSLAPLSREAASEVIFTVLEEPSPSVQTHLRRLADAYTLFAFLRQTPDVQKVVLEIFSGGEIWLDSTVVLPLLAETLVEEPLERHFTVLLGAAADAGFILHVTDGVVEEIERHLNRALACARTTIEDWRSRVPFLYGAYTLSGRARSGFADWLTEFRGNVTPEEDVKEYLLDEFRMDSRNLLLEAEGASTELRGAVQEIWFEAHERRRRRGDRSDVGPEIASRLVAHDVENTVGIMALRRGSARSATGYTQWWLTLDRIAFGLHGELARRLGGEPPASPALSPDFLSQLLRLGPLRSAIERELHVALPVVTTITKYESIPRDLIELADETRKRYEGQSERVVRRKVRDTLNEMRWYQGDEARAGVRGAEERVKARLAAQQDFAED